MTIELTDLHCQLMLGGFAVVALAMALRDGCLYDGGPSRYWYTGMAWLVIALATAIVAGCWASQNYEIRRSETIERFITHQAEEAAEAKRQGAADATAGLPAEAAPAKHREAYLEGWRERKRGGK